MVQTAEVEIRLTSIASGIVGLAVRYGNDEVCIGSGKNPSRKYSPGGKVQKCHVRRSTYAYIKVHTELLTA